MLESINYAQRWISHLKFWPTSNFWTYHNSRQHSFHKITKVHSHFQLKLKWEGKKTTYFKQEIN